MRIMLLSLIHICSRSGYFYAVTAGEVYSTIRQLKVMANGLDAAITGLELSLIHIS